MTNTIVSSKGVSLAKSASVAIAKSAPKAKVTAPTAIEAFSFANGSPVTFNGLRAWLNANAGGTNAEALKRVRINTLPSVNTDWEKQGLRGPVPFGFQGNPDGQRAQLMRLAIGNVTLADYLTACSKSPTTKCETIGNPNVLVSLLNGGFTPSSKTWGSPFLTLTVSA